MSNPFVRRSPRTRNAAPFLTLALLASTLVAGCGGSGGGSPRSEAPKIQAPPQSRTVSIGDAVTLSVTATGRDLTYQWSKGNAPIPGATGPTYAIASVTATDFGDYTVSVSSGGKTVDASASLRQQGAPVIVEGPQSVEEVAGRAVTLTVVATGDDPLAYAWYKVGSAATPVASANGPSLTLPALSPADEGAYYVVVSNAKGRATSRLADVSIVVEEQPRITLQPAPKSVALGASATFAVEATGGALTYQWRKDGAPIPDATDPRYTLAATTANDAGDYTVEVTNGKGSVVSEPARLTVVVPPAIATGPTSQTVNAGARVEFSVVATGTDLRYRWAKDGVDIPGATGATLTLDAATLGDAGSYAVVVGNAAGTATSAPATLTVRVPPAIASGPILVVNGGSTAVSVVATGTAPLAYQWLRNGVAVPGANAATYVIGTITPAKAGLYAVVVSNAAGSATSGAVAVLAP